MNQLIYVETSIPSFYFETRPGAQMQARREWTREWWELAKWQDALFTSAVVITELEDTPADQKRRDMLDLIEPLPRLPYTDEIDAIVEVYFKHRIMPLESGGDAHHLALASFHRCDMLATWNCKHIANPSKLPHIRLINGSLGLVTPQLLTPFELLETTP
ncbi:MAG: type II toxin-antitoxin system VapC family toxin [Verrucomicrobia bacterium]|nr:type II toxin-antitoxin system VapC family toxin [Verrucomicrobiota bacterium]